MNFVNKICIFISTLSLIVIGGSMYYYNETYSKQPVIIEKKEIKKEEIVQLKNIEVTTEIKDNNLLLIKLKNISNKDLYDVVIESRFKNYKQAEIYIENFENNSEKTIELDISKQSLSNSIKENKTIVNENRILERFTYSVLGEEGEILVTSLKDRKIDEYNEIVSNSNLSADLKDKLTKEIKSNISKNDIEKLFIENNLFDIILLSEDFIKFGNDKKLEIKNNIIETEPAINTPPVTNQQSQQEVTNSKQQVSSQVRRNNSGNKVTNNNLSENRDNTSTNNN